MNLPADINPGIRRSVILMQQWGYKTIDSGDGETHLYECDRECPYIVIDVPRHSMVTAANRLVKFLGGIGITTVPISPEIPDGSVSIQASYDPSNRIACIEVMGIHDRMLPKEDHE
jgi:hypothetical protein